MRMNNFNENPRESSKTCKNNLNQQSPNTVPKFLLEINKGTNNKPQNSFAKGKINGNKNFLFKNSLVFQRIQKGYESNLEILGMSLMKIMAHQLFDNGYSILKLNILKTIRHMEKQSIFHKYHVLFNFKTSPKELLTILNSSLKLIQNQMKIEKGLWENNLLIKKNSEEYQKNYIRIHQIVRDHIQQFQISIKFFQILIKMILMLVHYPKLDSMTKNLLPKQIYFIVCDYLDCRIEQNHHGYVLEKKHFIKQKGDHFQFGFINFPIAFFKLKSNHLLSKNQNTAAPKSTKKLVPGEVKSPSVLKRSRSQRNTSILNRKDFQPQSQLKGSVLFIGNDRHKRIQQCQSVFELGYDNSASVEKENLNISNLNGSDEIFQNDSTLNTTVSFHKKAGAKKGLGCRKSLNVQEIRYGDGSSLKCFICSHRKQMRFSSKVVQVKIQ